MTSNFLKSNLVIVTENTSGEIYTIQANSFEELDHDWNNECKFIPSNDATVYLFIVNGEVISPYLYSDFESVMNCLHNLYRQSHVFSPLDE